MHRVGRATVPAHHGEILQGTFADDGRLRRGLVTVPCPVYRADATFVPEPEPGIRVSPPWKSKARRGAELAMAALKVPGRVAAGGRLRISNDAPVRRGFGSSTSDVLAAVGAVESALGAHLTPPEVAWLAVKAEQASDSLMFDETTVLFAHRDGEVIEDFRYPMPRTQVLGFDVAVGDRGADGNGIDTLTFPPARYTDREIGHFGDLRARLRDAVCEKNVEQLGKVATASAVLNQRHLPVRQFATMRAAARSAGAVGVQVAHSGDIAGLLFDADVTDLPERLDCAKRLLTAAGITRTWTFTMGNET